MFRICSVILFLLIGRLTAQGWALPPEQQGLELTGLHRTDDMRNLLGGSVGYSWNDHFDLQIDYLWGEEEFQDQILEGNRLIPRLEWYALKSLRGWPVTFSFSAAYIQERFSDPRSGIEYKLTGHGWEAGASLWADILPRSSLRLMPVAKISYSSVSRSIRRAPSDQDLGTSATTQLTLFLIMGKQYQGGFTPYFKPGLAIGSGKPVLSARLGFVLPLAADK